MALPGLRLVVGAQDRQLRQEARHVPGLAAVAAHAGRHGPLEGDVQAHDLGVLGDMAHSPGHGRGLRRRAPRRHLAGAAGGGAGGKEPRARACLAAGPQRVLRGLGGADGARPRARHGSHRRRRRLRQGSKGRMAPHKAAEVHIPRVLPGQKVHHEPAEAPMRPGALRHRAQTAEGLRRRVSRGMAGLVRRMACEVGAVPGGIPHRGRQEEIRAQEAPNGQKRPGRPSQVRSAVHVRRDAAGARRLLAVDEQLHREHERPAKSDAAGPQGPVDRTRGEGLLLVAADAHRVPALGCRDIEDDAEGRGRGGPLRRGSEEEIRWRRGRWLRLRDRLERVPYAHRVQAVAERPLTHFLSHNPQIETHQRYAHQAQSCHPCAQGKSHRQNLEHQQDRW